MTVELKHMVISEARAMQLCKRIRQNMTDARNDLLELYEGEGWRALGYVSWRECVTTEFGEHERTLYRQLQAAKVIREIEQTPAAGEDVVQFDKFVKNKISEHSVAALAKAPEGARAEVLKVAVEASGGKLTEKVVKAAVEAKWAAPEATPEQLVEAVVKAAPTAAKPKPVVPEEVEEIREERAEQAAKRDEITDEEWLASLPLEGKLAGHVLDKFRRDALYFRDFEPVRRSLGDFHGKAKKRRFKGSASQGFVSFRVGQLLSVGHPKAWMECRPTEEGGCGGTGVRGIVGECNMCHGRGYIAK